MTEAKSAPPLGRRAALLIIDLQNDFFPRGSMEIEGAAKIVPIINNIKTHVRWEVVALCGDHHPQDHISFLSTHIHRSNVTIGSVITTPAGHQQILYPSHCVAGSLGAQFHSVLDRSPTDITIQKGAHRDHDNYSAFADAHQSNRTPLQHTLQSSNVTDVYVVGLGKDVANTAVDAAQAGFNTYVISDAIVDLSPEHERASTARLEKAHVTILHSRMLLEKRQDRRQEAAAYLEQHQLAPLFERLCSALVYAKPTDPRAFLVDELRKIKNEQGKGSEAKLASSTIFTESDFETMFRMMDPLSQGTLTSKQVSRALSDLGLMHAKTSVVDDVKYNLEQFKQLCVSSAIAPRTV